MSSNSIKLGVSACLLGQEVRYDGKHKRQYFIADTLSRYFDFLPLCPEVAIGMGVPRPPIQLVGTGKSFKACGVENTAIDVTGPLQDYAMDMVQAHNDLGGYIFKCRSPSCGAWDTPIVDESNEQVTTGSGIYAGKIQSSLPLLPLIDEERLLVPEYFESFVRQVTTYGQWQHLRGAGLSVETLREFHEDHRLLIQAHGPECREELDDLIKSAENDSLAPAAEKYIRSLLDVLARPASLVSHTDALLDIFNAMKGHMDPEARNDLSIAIASYHGNETTWQDPVARIVTALESGLEAEFSRQTYLYPHAALNLLQQGSILLYQSDAWR